MKHETGHFICYSSGQITCSLHSLIFHLPANYAGGDIVTFSMAVDGTLGGTRFEGPGFDNSEIFFSLFAPSNPLEFRRWTTPGTHSEVIQQQFKLPALATPTSFPVTFSAFVRLDSSQASGSFLVDMTNTAALSVDIPDHLSWESDSGIFLSNVSAVPEPPVAASFIAGLGVLLAVARRRRRLALNRDEATATPGSPPASGDPAFAPLIEGSHR